ncbi:glycoside hydrolase family 130 protein [Lapidilactobacillus luobeiensis]|uniref:glycoside hydrolase family 130 protein n=1 Tax=Lapidilactobacillus luobeiensis TaxID=2950371 RepID=UPI0021C43F81|nr:glycoside hydrolase family 130 protein [Lapidilactobacillus luobeiensis]
MHAVVGELHSSSMVHRYANNPVLTAQQVPYESSLVFNAGVIKYQGKYVMVFRNDYNYLGGTNFGGTNIGLAESNDGISWKVHDNPVFSLKTGEISRAYDPRLTVIDGKVYMCFAVDTKHGIRGGIASTDDFEHFNIISLSAPDNRNMVLFPEKINGMFTRLERPFTVYGRGGIDRFDIWSAQSPDLKFWGNNNLVLGVEDVHYANDKIGPAAPPIKTKYGWLTIFHAVDIDKSRGKHGWEDTWKKRYCAGLALLDLDDPSKVIGLAKEPLLAPETIYEIKDGFRTNVIFPTSMILENSGEVKIYYGASDTVVALATAQLDDLLKLVL